MSFLNRFRSPEERERREREKAEQEAARAQVAAAAEQARREAAERAAQRRLEEEAAAAQAYALEVLGAELAAMDVDSPAEARIAIKLARLRKKELQAEKRDLASQLADVREEWRDRTAGRYSTVGLGRGTGGRMVRAGIQAKRRSERQQHAGVVNEFSDARQEIERKIAMVDRTIIELERVALGRGEGASVSRDGPS